MLPVSPDVRHWFASPRAAIGFLMHAATLDGASLGDRRFRTMPGVSATVLLPDKRQDRELPRVRRCRLKLVAAQRPS